MSSPGRYAPEDDDNASDKAVIRAEKGTRAEVLEGLRSTLSQKPVEAYRNLLDQIVQDGLDLKEDKFNTTQDGVVVWSSREKRILYHFLDRKGKNGIREISGAIGSKSELEVQEYLRLLHKGLRRQHLNDSHARTVVLGDIPAAAEISAECCKVLDEYAELLCLEEQVEEDIAGKKKHQDLWIIDREVAGLVEERSKTLDGELRTTSTIESAAELLDMKKWIQLSERAFMNFGGSRLGDNWANIALEDETPSMTADAFVDFYELARKLTRDLVEAAQLCATSRHRRGRRDSRPPESVVRSSDVRRAARMLNIKRDSYDFWTGLARRCSLDVSDIRHKKHWKPVRLNHDEVESILSGKVTLPDEPYEKITSEIPLRRYSASASSTISFDSHDSEEDLEIEHAEAVDQQNSRAEELQCWSLLGQQAPESLSTPIEEETLPRKPVGKRKTMEDLVDWRDRTPYRSEWEEYGYETRALDKKIERNHRKRRRTDQSTIFRPLSASLTQDTKHIDRTESIPDMPTGENPPENTTIILPHTSQYEGTKPEPRPIPAPSESWSPKHELPKRREESGMEVDAESDPNDAQSAIYFDQNEASPGESSPTSNKQETSDEELSDSENELPNLLERKSLYSGDEEEDDEDEQTDVRLFSAPTTPFNMLAG